MDEVAHAAGPRSARVPPGDAERQRRQPRHSQHRLSAGNAVRLLHGPAVDLAAVAATKAPGRRTSPARSAARCVWPTACGLRPARRAGASKQLPPNTGMGIAVSSAEERQSPTWVAGVAEVTVDPATGKYRINKLTIAMDMGTAINPHERQGADPGLGAVGRKPGHVRAADLQERRDRAEQLPRVQADPAGATCRRSTSSSSSPAVIRAASASRPRPSSRRRWPTPSSTPSACACGTCRSRPRRCWRGSRARRRKPAALSERSRRGRRSASPGRGSVASQLGARRDVAEQPLSSDRSCHPCIGGDAMSDDILSLSAAELIEHYRTKQLSPVEVDARGARPHRQAAIRSTTPSSWSTRTRRCRRARESEARWQRGAPAGLVDGLPTTVKDLILAKGWPTLRGSRTIDPNQPWDEDGAAGRAHARAGRGVPRQDHHAGVRLEGRDRQPAHRRHASIPGTRDLTPGRQQRRRGGGGRAAAWACCTSPPTAAARSAFPRASAACSASSRPSASCRSIPIRPR